MADDEDRRHAGDIGGAAPALLGGQSLERQAGEPAVRRPGAGAGAQAPLVLRIGIGGGLRPVGVVAFPDDSAAVQGHELAQARVNPRTVQAFVEILPEDLPVALDGLGEHVTHGEILERPGIEPVERRIEIPVEGGRILQGHEHEAPCLAHPDLVQRVVRGVEPLAMPLGRRAQQVPLQAVRPGMVGADEGAGPKHPCAFAAQGRAPVPAGVVEALQHPVVVPDQQHPLIAEFEAAKGPRPGHVRGPADVDPVPLPDPPQLLRRSAGDRSRPAPAAPRPRPSARCTGSAAVRG